MVATFSQRNAPAKSAFGGASAAWRLAQLSPNRIFRDQHPGTGMLQQLPMLAGGEFVIQRHQHAAGIKYRVRRNQPFGLVGHNNCRAIGGAKTEILQRSRNRHRRIAKLSVCQPVVLSLAIHFNQADLHGKHLHGIF
jgi:hypothetical protein